MRLERVDAGRHAGNQVRDAEPPLRQPGVLFRSNWLGNQPGVIEQLPESIGVAREVMADGRRANAGVDADK